MRCRWLGFIGGGITLSVAAPAAAASISLRAASECGEEGELRFRVERIIGTPLAQAAPLHFDLALARDAGGFVARLGVVEQPGAAVKQRVLRAADCDTLQDTVSVAVALALGAEAAGEKGDELEASTASGVLPSDDLAATRRDTGAESSKEARPEDAAEPEPDTWSAALSAWFLGDVGSLPAPSLGAVMAADLSWRRLQLVALGTLLFDRSVDLSSMVAPGAGATLGLAMGSLLICSRWFESHPVTSLACLGGEAGRLSGSGSGVSNPRHGSSAWLAPRLDVAAFIDLPDTPLQVGLWMTAAAPLNRDDFSIGGVGGVYRPPSVVGRGAFGARVSF